MTRSVITLSPETGAVAALELFRRHAIRRAPVVEHGKLVGMVALSDLYRVLPTTVQRQELFGECFVPIGAVMSSPVRSLAPGQHLEDAARIMLEHKLGGLPVLEDGAIVGILTESDVFRALIGISSGEDEWRISFQRGDSRSEPLDPVLVALRCGARVRAYFQHERPGGMELHLLRLRGGRQDALVEALEVAGYVVIELSPLRTDGASGTAA